MSVPSLIGMLMLMGIVTKNSILLVEYAIIAMQDHALSIRDALIDACHKRDRPIVMTTVAIAIAAVTVAWADIDAEPRAAPPAAMVVTCCGGGIRREAGEAKRHEAGEACQCIFRSSSPSTEGVKLRREHVA